MDEEYVLITGATSGIGYELMLLFAKSKKNLLLVSRNKEKLSKIQSQIEKKYNIKVEYIDLDLSFPDASCKIYHFVTNNKLKISILVNNAGVGLGGEFQKNDIKKYEDMVNLNIMTLTKLTYFILQDMKKERNGKILNLASVASFIPGPYMSVYFATKAYVLSFSESLFFEGLKDNISVTAVCPGSTKTNFAKTADLQEKRVNKNAMSAKRVALIGYNGLMKNKRVVITGGMNKFAVFFIKIVPHSIIGKFIIKINNPTLNN